MRALFLDIDGVIATPTSMRKNRERRLEPHEYCYDAISLMYVGQLVARTGAQVVLSSTWREDLDTGDAYLRAIVDNLCDQLSRSGAPIADVTPSIAGADRSAEVAAWLDGHPCEAWAIIDDRARFEQRPDVCDGHLVIIEDSGGIRHQHFVRALEILSPEAC